MERTFGHADLLIRQNMIFNDLVETGNFGKHFDNQKDDKIGTRSGLTNQRFLVEIIGMVETVTVAVGNSVEKINTDD